jgi:hypothetical protein
MRANKHDRPMFIRITFKRFILLRSIAEAARVGDTSRSKKLLSELQSQEIKDFMDFTMEPENDFGNNNYRLTNGVIQCQLDT